MTEQEQDYMFDLQGYLILRNAISKQDLAEMNQWVDDHWNDVENANLSGTNTGSNQWIGNVELHSYGKDDGVNFQNIIEGAPVFERMIDNPAWFSMAQRYINPANGISIHENFLNVRGSGGFLYIHCGGHVPLCYLTFRNHNTGEWMVGQINVIMALTDIGPGDGPTVLVPGSHKCTEIHPRLEQNGKGLIAIDDHQAAGTALGMQEMYLNAGDALFFTDTVTHGSAQRINPGHRRVVIYRYSPRFIRTRFNYEWSDGLMNRLTPARKQIIEPVARRRAQR